MDESTGWGGQFWLHDGTQLVKLDRVTEMGLPEDTTDEHEVTTLEAPGRFKEYIAGLRDGGEFSVTMNYIPGSATDTLCRAAKTAADVRPYKCVVPGTDGTPERQFEGTCFAKSYNPDPLNPNAPKKITLVLRNAGAVTEGGAS